jgi:hypothetical protein
VKEIVVVSEKEVLPVGKHPFDPGDDRLDPICWELHRLEAQIIWAYVHGEEVEKGWIPRDEQQTACMYFQKDALRQAVMHFQRLKELLLSGVTIDNSKKRLNMDSETWSELVEVCAKVLLEEPGNRDATK